MLWKEVGNVQKIYVCHDDITGIFSAVYDAWKERRETGDAGIAFKGSVEQKLFCEYTECEEREEKCTREAVEHLLGYLFVLILRLFAFFFLLIFFCCLLTCFVGKKNKVYDFSKLYILFDEQNLYACFPSFIVNNRCFGGKRKNNCKKHNKNC